MKYVVVLYDGMADYPVPALDGKTPMQVGKARRGRTYPHGSRRIEAGLGCCKHECYGL